MIEEAPTGSIQEPPARDDDVLVLTPNAKTDFRLTIEPSVMLLLLGANITCEYRLILLFLLFVLEKLCLVCVHCR